MLCTRQIQIYRFAIAIKYASKVSKIVAIKDCTDRHKATICRKRDRLCHLVRHLEVFPFIGCPTVYICRKLFKIGGIL